MGYRVRCVHCCYYTRVWAHIRGGETCGECVEAYQNHTVAAHKHHLRVTLRDLGECASLRTLMVSAPVSSATCTS